MIQVSAGNDFRPLSLHSSRSLLTQKRQNWSLFKLVVLNFLDDFLGFVR